MPTPKKGQRKEEYIKMFMEDKDMVDKHPDEKQRYAIAESEWEKYSKNKLESESEMITLDKTSGEIKPTERPQWIKTFPRGDYYIQGRGKLTFDSNFFDNVITAFESPTLSKPFIDKNHKMEESYADILELEERKDGLYSRIKLNEDGINQVKNNKYKYISPAFMKAVDTNENVYPNRLCAISLTNSPALEGAMPELQNQIQLSKYAIAKEYKEMEVLNMAVLTELSKIYSLESDTSEDILLEKVKESVGKITMLEKEIKEKEETISTLKTSIEKDRLTALEKEAESYISDMIKLGKLEVSTQDLDKEDYLKDPERFKKRMELTKVKEVNLDFSQSVVDEGKGAKFSGVTLEKTDLDTMKEIGLDPKDKEDIAIYLDKVRRKLINKGGTK